LRAYHATFGEDADFLSRAFPGIDGMFGQAFAVVQVFLIEAVGVGGIEEADALIEGDVDEMDGFRFAGPIGSGESKEAEGERAGEWGEEFHEY
jgi:hypothetical protein